MSESATSAEEYAALSARNIGGIDTADVEFAPGVNVLVGQNATNRSSLLQAVIGALGGSNVSLKGDADRGETTLTLEGERYTRTLVREERDVFTEGDPLLADAEVADLFAFLMESNEARRTVARAGDLRELIVSPIDTEKIETEIRQLKRRRSEIDGTIREIDEEERRLPGLIQERSSLEDEIEETEYGLEEIRAELAELEPQAERDGNATERLEDRLNERQRLESNRDDVSFDLRTERESLESLRQERAELEAELEEIPEVSEERLADVQSRLQRARDQQTTLESTVNRMQNIIQFNERSLEDDDALFGRIEPHDGEGLFGSLRSEGSTDLLGTLRTEQAVTDQLIEEQQSLTCWTCGSTVKKARIKQMLEELRTVRAEQLDALSEAEADVQELQETERKLRTAADRRDDIETELDRIDTEIETRRERIHDLEAREADLEEQIVELNEEIASLRADVDAEPDEDRRLELREEKRRLEVELDRLRTQLEETVEEIDAIEADLERRSNLEAERSEIDDRLTELRQRVEQIEQEAVDEFNERMSEILEILEYSNIERIWIERIEEDTESTASSARFDLHIVRMGDDGESYWDAVDHLSESEREVTGLVFALAGYLVHNVHESMPFMIIDSLEAIDSDRIAKLVDYLSAYPKYLVVALLPEDAAALDDGHRYLSPPW